METYNKEEEEEGGETDSERKRDKEMRKGGMEAKERDGGGERDKHTDRQRGEAGRLREIRKKKKKWKERGAEG